VSRLGKIQITPGLRRILVRIQGPARGAQSKLCNSWRNAEAAPRAKQDGVICSSCSPQGSSAGIEISAMGIPSAPSVRDHGGSGPNCQTFGWRNGRAGLLSVREGDESEENSSKRRAMRIAYRQCAGARDIVSGNRSAPLLKSSPVAGEGWGGGRWAGGPNRHLSG
jgi:hypothetical protein